MNNFKKNALVAIIAASASLLSVANAAASTTESTGYIDVKLTLESGCSIGSGVANGTPTSGSFGTLDFGRHSTSFKGIVTEGSSFQGQKADGQLDLTVTCNTTDNKDTVEVVIVESENQGDGAARKLVNGADEIAYGVYSDPNRVTVVNNGENLVPGGKLVNGKAKIALYGQAELEGDDVKAAGEYTDRLTVSVKF